MTKGIVERMDETTQRVSIPKAETTIVNIDVRPRKTAEDMVVGCLIGGLFGLLIGLTIMRGPNIAHARTHGYADVDLQAAAAYRARTRNLCYQCAAGDQNCTDHYCNEQRQLADAAMYGTL